MLLGELIENGNVLREQIEDIKNYLAGKTSHGKECKLMLDILYSSSFDYEVCKTNINNIVSKLEINMAEDKKPLTNLFSLRNAMLERIENITYLIRNKCINEDTFVTLIKQKKEYIKEYMYINSFINKTIWSVTLDN